MCVTYFCYAALVGIFLYQPTIVSLAHGFLLGNGFVPTAFEEALLAKYFSYAWYSLGLGLLTQEFAGAYMYYKYRAKPGEYAEFQQKLERMSDEAGIRRPTLIVMERFSRTLNAAATHSLIFGPKIIVMGHILETLENNEGDAVLAHEVSHLRNLDLWGLVVVHAGNGAIGWQKFALLSSMAYALFGLRWRELVFLGATWAVISVTHTVFKLVMALLSRSREYLADVGAVALVGWENRHALITGLARIQHAMTGWRPFRIFKGEGTIFDSHPHISARARALKLDPVTALDDRFALREVTA